MYLMSFHYKEVVTPRETTPCTSSQLYRFYVGIYEGSMLGQTKRHLPLYPALQQGQKQEPREEQNKHTVLLHTSSTALGRNLLTQAQLLYT